VIAICCTRQRQHRAMWCCVVGAGCYARPGRDVTGDWRPARRGWSRPQTAGGVDLLLPVTLVVVADEMLSKKIKKWNFVEQTNDRVLRVTRFDLTFAMAPNGAYRCTRRSAGGFGIGRDSEPVWQYGLYHRHADVPPCLTIPPDTPQMMHNWFINIACCRQVPPRRVNRSAPEIASVFSGTVFHCE